jgi:hypothetical protein
MAFPDLTALAQWLGIAAPVLYAGNPPPHPFLPHYPFYTMISSTPS